MERVIPFSVCIFNSLCLGSTLAANQKQKGTGTVWLSIFIFIETHVAIATFNTLHVSWYCAALKDVNTRYIKPACYPSFSISIVKTHLKQCISICHPAGFGYSIQRRLSGGGSCSYTCVLVSHLHVCQRWELQLAGFLFSGAGTGWSRPRTWKAAHRRPQPRSHPAQGKSTEPATEWG